MSDLIPSTLGSIIGYLGAEVAENTVFERLLWPQRFYHHLSPSILFQLAMLHPMGGPLHRAALQTLDTFRDKGIYRGYRRGHMAGTAFHSDCGKKYIASSEPGKRKDARNGFWLMVMQAAEWWPSDLTEAQRAIQPVFRLHIQAGRRKPEGAVEVREDVMGWGNWVGIGISEVSALAAALVAGCYMKVTWLPVYFMVPLMLKILAALTAVKRQLLEEVEESQEEIFEVDDLDKGFFLITGQDLVVRQFFRHYGDPRPKRVKDERTGSHIWYDRKQRTKELLGLLWVYAFIFYFPIGLVLLLWMDNHAQYLWMGYQVYTIAAMHVVRLGGFGGAGRTEERMARILTSGKQGQRNTVWLTDSSCNGIAATLIVETVNSVADGKKRVTEIKEAWASAA
ncbi:hypothetical protein BZA77DRAFT_69020 [Pyronema omphalodes]|nr:hypothetical protein BZA77DRAFT_69020 [Pyronema omphalodes]